MQITVGSRNDIVINNYFFEVKITIQNKSAIVLQFRFFGAFLGLFVFTFIALGLLGYFDEGSGFAGVLLAPIPSLLYALYILLDSYMFASHAHIELRENSIDIYFKNLITQGNVVLPVSQIESVNVV